MLLNNILVSIIIVHYNVKEELFLCIESIIKSNPKVVYEVIVVDNNGKKVIESKLKKKFPKVKYIKTTENIGFGRGNNLGAKYAKGKYLFFLNPDTKVFPFAVDELTKFIENKKDVGVVAPLLLDKNNNSYQQGSKKLGLLQGIVVLSFINKVFPNNPISKKYLLSSWDKKTLKEVDVVPGTAFMIEKAVFEKVGKFDEKFFLYFEEFDLCRRVKRLGHKLFILPSAKVMHTQGASTKKSNLNISNVFKKSRFYYFKKNYGSILAFVVEFFATFGKNQFLIFLILILGAFLRFYRLGESMSFIGDYGWFYLAARDMILNKEIPLIGITASHTWLHQGPFWTYILALVLGIFKFNPISGGIFTATAGILTIFLIYKISKEIFSEKVGLISSLLYATSPLVIANDRTPYHITLIPFFTLFLLFSIYKWINRKVIFFPLTIFFLQVLYNFELATQVLWGIVFFLLGFGIWRKKEWCVNLFTKKILLLSFIAFILPMTPIIIHDLSHDFSQTFRFILWVPYRIIKNLGILSNFNPSAEEGSFVSIFLFFKNFYQKLIFAPNGLVTFFIFFMSIIRLIFYFSSSTILLSLFIMIPLFGILINKTASEAYLPIFFPTIIILTGWVFSKMMIERKTTLILFALLFFISFSNLLFFLKEINNDSSYKRRINAAQKIVKEAEGKEYNLVGMGKGSQFQSFTMNYEYLTWWLGKAPSKKKEVLKFYVDEADGEIKISKISL